MIKEKQFSSYKSQFEEAYKRTLKFDLHPPKVRYSNDIFLGDYFLREVPNLLKKWFGNIAPADLVVNCMGFNLNIQPLLEEYLSSDVYYTIGYILLEKKTYFYIEDNIIKSMLENIFNFKPLNIHVWLALPTMEILDFTFASTFANANNNPICDGGIIAEKADNLKGDISYHPVLIGDELLRKHGAIVDFYLP